MHKIMRSFFLLKSIFKKRLIFFLNARSLVALFCMINVISSYSVHAQHVIIGDEQEISKNNLQRSHEAKDQMGSNHNDSDSAEEVTLEVSADEKKKILILLKKIFPQKSWNELHQQLMEQLKENKLTLSKAEIKKLYDVTLQNEKPNQGSFSSLVNSALNNKIENLAVGTAGNPMADSLRQMSDAFKNNPMAMLSKDDVKKMIIASAQAKSKSYGEFMEHSPKLLEFFAEMITDKVAMPSLLSIFKREADLKQCAILGLVIQFMLMLSFFALFRYQSFIARFSKRFLLYVFCNGLLFYYYWYQFNVELTPTWLIIKRIFFA